MTNNSTVELNASFGVIDTCFMFCLGVIATMLIFTLVWAGALKLVEWFTGE